MTEILLAILTLFFVGSNADKGQATFHVQQKVGIEIKLFDGDIAFMKTKEGYTYYLKINEYVRGENGKDLQSKQVLEWIVRTGEEKEPLIILDRVQKTYKATSGEQWFHRDFPKGIISGFGIDSAEKDAFLVSKLTDVKFAYFNRLDNGGFMMRVKNRNKNDLVQSLTMQADNPGKKEWFKEAYVVNVTFEIADKAPDDSIFEIPNGFQKK
jgi:hypothetical protein